MPQLRTKVAWQIGYDQLGRHLRYDCKLEGKEVNRELAVLDGSYYPMMLPGLKPNSTYVFADTLSFYGVAMVADTEREPRAAVAMLKSALGLTEDELVTTVGASTSEVLGSELQRYVQFHGLTQADRSVPLKVNALKPGDGATVTRALGALVKYPNPTEQSPQEEDTEASVPLRFELNLYPADARSDVTGQFLRRIAERHRSGVSGILPEDRWIVDNRIKDLPVPRLRWSRKMEQVPDTAAHISVSFDAFDTNVTTASITALSNNTAALAAYGLQAALERKYESEPQVQWLTYLPPEFDGEKHPAGRGITERLLRVHKMLLSACAVNLGQAGGWPVLLTRLPYDAQETMRRVHDLSDWVITVDRNAGVEFFDSPRNNQSIFDAYVIDCVPERTDIGNMRMVTSTTRVDEVRDILDDLLGSMGVSSSKTQCDRLLRALKGLSGRLAMRMTNKGSRTEELVALALTYEGCWQATDDKFWLPLNDGFLVPLDDILDLLPPTLGNRDDKPKVRSDLIYVGLGPRKIGLSFTFIEVKYRRSLRDANSSQLHDYIAEQLQTTHKRWHEWYFNSTDAEPVLALRRARLARVLRFYADKAARHTLSAEYHALYLREIDRLLITLKGYKLAERADDRRGYVFCPAYNGLAEAPRLVEQSTVRIFGSTIPKLETSQPIEPIVSVEKVSNATADTFQPEMDAPIEPLKHDTPVTDTPNPDTTRIAYYAPNLEPIPAKQQTENQCAEVVLGNLVGTEEACVWKLSSKSNPHLMIVGLPGMGKTEALLNISKQLFAQGIVPIVLSYHPDIDDRMQEALGNVQLLTNTELGYNPMQVNHKREHAHLDNAGALKDIFGAVWPDLGDVQMSELRKALVWSYEETGWGPHSDGTQQIPDFSAFYRRLKREDKPDKGLKTMLARLDELADYGFFNVHANTRSLLESEVPCVVGLHNTESETLQRAMAMFALHSIYGNMFRHGVQSSITHTIIVDEAHRASKLKLLVKLAKEGRKFGLSIILASQAASDYDPDLYSGIANYLLLRMVEQDAYSLAKTIWPSDIARGLADRLKQLDKYHALFSQESQKKTALVKLKAFES